MTEQEPNTDLLTKEDVKQLLKGRFGKQIHVSSFEASPATQPGDNFGSTLLSLVVHIQRHEEAHAETFNIIAKMAPPTDFLREVFDFPVTFCKEMYVYKFVAPAFLSLQQDYGISGESFFDLMPQFYGARTSLLGDNDERAHSNAVLLLRNVKPDGYKVADRLNGLDLKHSELVVTNISAFHAMAIALKQKKPDVFKETVLKSASKPFHIGPKDVDDEEELNKMLGQLVENAPECRIYEEKFRKCINLNEEFCFKGVSKEPFATLVHNDLWTNNMLFKYKNCQGLEVPCALKIVDFQVTSYCSPVKDLIFFLYSSVQMSVLEKYYEHLVNLYYDGFINELEKLQCDTRMYPKSSFLNEISEFAGTQLFRLILMTGVIYARKEDAEELSDIDSVDHFIPVGKNPFCRQRIMQIIEVFNKRGWLDSKVK